MATLESYLRAHAILLKVIEPMEVVGEPEFYFTSPRFSENDLGEEIKCEVYFFSVDSNIYLVNLYADGGIVQLYEASEQWSVFPPALVDSEEMDLDKAC